MGYYVIGLNNEDGAIKSIIFDSSTNKTIEVENKQLVNIKKGALKSLRIRSNIHRNSMPYTQNVFGLSMNKIFKPTIIKDGVVKESHYTLYSLDYKNNKAKLVDVNKEIMETSIDELEDMDKQYGINNFVVKDGKFFNDSYDITENEKAEEKAEEQDCAQSIDESKQDKNKICIDLNEYAQNMQMLKQSEQKLDIDVNDIKLEDADKIINISYRDLYKIILMTAKSNDVITLPRASLGWYIVEIKDVIESSLDMSKSICICTIKENRNDPRCLVGMLKKNMYDNVVSLSVIKEYGVQWDVQATIENIKINYAKWKNLYRFMSI